jgi:hypothetical protein
MEVYFKVTKVTDKIPEILNSDGVIGCDKNGFNQTIVYNRKGFDIYGLTHFMDKVKSIDKLVDEKDQLILEQQLTINEFKNPITKEMLEVTGFDNLTERLAYDRGRKDEQKVIMDWIKNWKGTTHSKMGVLLDELVKKHKDDK